MINRTHRFHGYNSLNYAYRNGQTIRLPHITLKYVVNSRRDTFRVAVVISRKVSKSSVVRNRIRRRIYEFVRLNEGRINKPFDIVISVFSEDLANEPIKNLQIDLEHLLKQAGILSKPESKAQSSHDIVKGQEN